MGASNTLYRFACQRNLVSGSILWLSSATLTLNAQSTDTYSSDALREQYIKELEKASIYSSAPITHLSPSRNRISYALGVDLPNYTMTPDTEDPDYIEYPGVSSSLELTGWSVTPHFSLSLKKSRNVSGSIYRIKRINTNPPATAYK